MTQQDYVRKARILRRIMSGKAARFKCFDALINIFTVLIAGLVTFVGFNGSDRTLAFLNESFQSKLSLLVFSFCFNLFTFALLVLIFLQLYFRFPDRKREADSAIVELSSFMNFINDRQADVDESRITPSGSDLELIREKYRSIISSIPSNTDSEYIKAKLQERSSIALPKGIPLRILGSKVYELETLEAIIRSQDDLMGILGIVRNLSESLWVGGGIFRNAVWNTIHGYETGAPIDDVDVIYFNTDFVDKKFDEKFEMDLTRALPTHQWSVKNQARMHLHNNEDQYNSLEDAVARWPETCTAFCVRLESTGELSVIRPHELTDLFSLVIRPTPNFVNRKARIMDRVLDKEWQSKWPRLRLLL